MFTSTDFTESSNDLVYRNKKNHIFRSKLEKLHESKCDSKRESPDYGIFWFFLTLSHAIRSGVQANMMNWCGNKGSEFSYKWPEDLKTLNSQKCTRHLEDFSSDIRNEPYFFSLVLPTNLSTRQKTCLVPGPRYFAAVNRFGVTRSERKSVSLGYVTEMILPWWPGRKQYRNKASTKPNPLWFRLCDFFPALPISCTCMSRSDWLTGVLIEIASLGDFGFHVLTITRQTALVRSYDTWVKTGWCPHSFASEVAQFYFAVNDKSLSSSFYKTLRLPQIYHSLIIRLTWHLFCQFCVIHTYIHHK